MPPGDLLVLCPFTATKLAKSLQRAYINFSESIVHIGARHLKKAKDSLRASTSPSFSDIGYIFSLSFFKLISSKTKTVVALTPAGAAHDGWSSGSPANWRYTLKSLCGIHGYDHNSKGIIGSLMSLFKLPLTTDLTDGREDIEEDLYDFEDDDDQDPYSDDYDDFSSMN